MVEGNGAIHAAGSKDPRGLVVQITDETGQPAEGVAVSFRLPEEGPSGTFARGMKTDVTTTVADGRAAVYGMVWNRLPGPFQIRVTAIKGQIRAGTIVSQYISDAPAAKEARVGSNGRRKWATIAVLVGGGAAAALVAGSRKSPSAAAAPPAAPPPQIGMPTISIGKP